MSVGINNVIKAFDLLYRSLNNRDFQKSLRFHEWGEQALLPLVRTFLLGYFGKSLIPEAPSKLPGSLSGNGRIDFIVGGVAIEFVVRKPSDTKAALSKNVNNNEIKKLMKHDGHAVLILFDFSKYPYTEKNLEKFREWPSLGKGSHKKSAFNVAYYYKNKKRGMPIKYRCIRRNIHVK